MKTRKLATILWAVIVMFNAAYAEEEKPQELSNTRFATATIKITTDPQILPMGRQRYEPLAPRLYDLDLGEPATISGPVVGDDKEVTRLGNILDSPELFRAAEREVFGNNQSGLKMREDFQIALPESPKMVGNLQTIRIKLSVRLGKDLKPAAEEFIDVYVKKLKAEMEKQYKSEMGIFYKRHQQHTIIVSDAEMELKRYLDRQNELSGRMPLDKESVLRQRMEHERAAREVGLRQAILEKRAKELSHHLQTTQAEIESRINNDDVLRELRRLVEQQESEFAKIVQAQKAGRVTDRDVGQIREELIRTQIELAQRQEELRNEAGREELAEIERQFRETTMQLEELRIEETILMGTDPGSLSKSAEYEILQVKIDAARENLHDAIREQKRHGRQINLIQAPEVKIETISFSEKAPEDVD